MYGLSVALYQMEICKQVLAEIKAAKLKEQGETMDIREQNSRTVIFADDTGGTGRCIKLQRCVPVQFELVDRRNNTMHVMRDDIDNLIKALQYAKQHWGK